jgi:glucokinase
MHVLAIDTGATKIAAAVADEHGNLLEKKRWLRGAFLPTPKENAMRIYQEILDDFRLRYDIAAVGLGAGGRVDVHTGKFMFGTGGVGSGWFGVNIIDEMEAIAHCPVAIENDCKVAMVGENWKGVTQGIGCVLGVILGTGIGGGFTYKNEMVYGHRYGAGEVGHMVLYPGGKPCSCGQRGCSEMYCCGTSLWTDYNERVGAARIASGHEFFKLVEKGDPDARAVLSKFAHDLAVLLATCGNLIEPEAFLIGGGLAYTADLWWDAMLEEYRKEAAPFLHAIPILRSKLGNDAALYGGVKIALDRLGRRN